jgi:hypothetical protein
MKASEILRNLSDLVARAEMGGQSPNSPNQAALTPVHPDTEDHTEQTVMITPLQQKQELLKKAAGVESFYDNEHGDCEQCGSDPCACGQDPLSVLKQNAGLPVIIQDIGGEENDILG